MNFSNISYPILGLPTSKLTARYQTPLEITLHKYVLFVLPFFTILGYVVYLRYASRMKWHPMFHVYIRFLATNDLILCAIVLVNKVSFYFRYETAAQYKLWLVLVYNVSWVIQEANLINTNWITVVMIGKRIKALIRPVNQVRLYGNLQVDLKREAVISCVVIFCLNMVIAMPYAFVYKVRSDSGGAITVTADGRNSVWHRSYNLTIVIFMYICPLAFCIFGNHFIMRHYARRAARVTPVGAGNKSTGGGGARNVRIPKQSKPVSYILTVNDDESNSPKSSQLNLARSLASLPTSGVVGGNANRHMRDVSSLIYAQTIHTMITSIPFIINGIWIGSWNPDLPWHIFKFQIVIYFLKFCNPMMAVYINIFFDRHIRDMLVSDIKSIRWK